MPMKRLLDFNHYTVAWIAALPIEAEAAICALDVRHDGQFPCVRGDGYIYIGGEINGHNVVVATLPYGQLYGTNSAAALGSHVKARFPNIWFALLVGVCAGLPNVSSTSSATEQWHKIVPNSKVNMSIIIQRHERDVCGRCFRFEDTSGSGTVKCTNCGLEYSKIGAWKGKSNDQKTHPTVSPIIESSTRPQTPANIATRPDQVVQAQWDPEAILGYEEELEHFTRVDFQVTMKTEPIISVVTYLSRLIEFGFYILEQHGHHLQGYPEQLTRFQTSFRHCHYGIESLMADGYSHKIGRAWSVAGGVDIQNSLNIRKIRASLRYEFTTMYRTYQHDGLLRIPDTLVDAIDTCTIYLRELKSSIGTSDLEDESADEEADGASTRALFSRDSDDEMNEESPMEDGSFPNSPIKASSEASRQDYMIQWAVFLPESTEKAVGRMVLDMGSDVNLISADFAARLGLQITPADGTSSSVGIIQVSILGQTLADWHLKDGGETYTSTFCVANIPFDAVLGHDEIRSYVVRLYDSPQLPSS